MKCNVNNKTSQGKYNSIKKGTENTDIQEKCTNNNNILTKNNNHMTQEGLSDYW